MTTERFEISTWAEAEVTPGPGREQAEIDDQGDEPETEQETEK